MKNLSRRSLLKNGIRASALILLAKGGYNTTSKSLSLEKTEVVIPNLPLPFKGLKVALLSDFHASAITSEALLRESAKLTMGENPDIILLCGDFITGSTEFLNTSVGTFKQKHLDKLTRAMSILKAPMGIYGVLGNHDFWSGEYALSAILKDFKDKVGLRWLRDEVVKIKKGGRTLDLIGIDDYWSGGTLIKALNGVGLMGGKKNKKKNTRLLLSHNPDVNEEIDALGHDIDLVLSGHTHGGQISLPLVGVPYVPSNSGSKYLKGLVRDGARQTYITRGIGNLILPIRFNALPEVTILTLS
ncbi:MAG: metallophosphoesterase [Deltaproteobacteria bacterium]|nr:metallophosphoesterase [Deltaproteobacteria bacterium]